MKNKIITIPFKGELYKEDLMYSLNQLDDKEKAQFALDLGENGDLSYELYLLQLITDLTINEYSDIEDDKNMNKVVKTLLQLKEDLKFLDNE